MNMRPRISQALLAALCPAGEFRESVLGDLAEEYAERVDRDGARAARRWYLREATRAAPYAMLAWFRGLRIGEAAQLVAITVGTVIADRLFQYSLMWLVVASWGTIADSQGLLLSAWRDVEEFRPVTAAAVGAAGWLVPIASGYVAARLQRRAPLSGAIGVGLLLALLVLGFGLVLIWTASGARFDHTLLITAPSGWLGYTTLGGVLRVWQEAQTRRARIVAT
jgi:hypothetical protein